MQAAGRFVGISKSSVNPSYTLRLDKPANIENLICSRCNCSATIAETLFTKAVCVHRDLCTIKLVSRTIAGGHE